MAFTGTQCTLKAADGAISTLVLHVFHSSHFQTPYLGTGYSGSVDFLLFAICRSVSIGQFGHSVVCLDKGLSLLEIRGDRKSVV